MSSHRLIIHWDLTVHRPLPFGKVHPTAYTSPPLQPVSQMVMILKAVAVLTVAEREILRS